MKKYSLIIVLLWLCGVLSSCVVNRPYANEPDPIDVENKMYLLSNKHYKRKITAVGIVCHIGLAGAGAVVGQTEKPTVFYENGKQTTNQTLNTTIGGAIGWGIAGISSRLAGNGTRKEIKDYEEWLKKYNQKYKKDYRYFKSPQRTGVISASIESSFFAKSLDDAYVFNDAFPNSLYADRVVQQCIDDTQFTRVEYERLLAEVFPATPLRQKVAEKHLSLAKTTDEVIASVKLYPELKAQAESKAVLEIETLEDVYAVRKLYPNSTHLQNHLKPLANKFKRYEIKALTRMYKNHADAMYLKKKFLQKSKTLAEVLEVFDIYPEVEKNQAKYSYNYVRTLDEANTYFRKFPNSKYEDTITKNVLIKSTNSFASLKNAIQKYPSFKSKYEYKGFQIAKKGRFDDCIEFLKLYPRSKYINQLAGIIPQKITSINQVETAIKTNYSLKDTLEYKAYQIAHKEDYATCKHFFKLYKPSRYDSALVRVIPSKADDIPTCGQVARDFPQHYEKMDKKAYSYTDNRDIDACRSYLKWFSNGNYRSQVQKSLKSAIAYEKRQAEIAEERRRRKIPVRYSVKRNEIFESQERNILAYEVFFKNSYGEEVLSNTDNYIVIVRIPDEDKPDYVQIYFVNTENFFNTLSEGYYYRSSGYFRTSYGGGQKLTIPSLGGAVEKVLEIYMESIAEMYR